MNGDQLKRLRTEQGWSQQKLADLLNPALDRKYTSSTVSSWETGKKPLPGSVATFLQGLELSTPLPEEHMTYEPDPDFPYQGGDEGDTMPPPPPPAGSGDGAASLPLPIGSSPYARVCEELFELVATGVGMVGAVTGSEKLRLDGEIILADKKNLGKAYGKLAETNATFRNMLAGMTGGGAWLEVALVSGITAGKLMRNHQRPRAVVEVPETPAEEGVTFSGDGSVVSFPTPATSI